MTGDLATILCIDDEEDILEVVKLSLETLGGYTIHTASSGMHGIQRAAELQPDLIMLDVMMPGMDGPSTLKLIQANDAINKIPVVFMTARVQPTEVSEYLSFGVTGVIAKPFDPMQLAGQIQKIWENRS